MFSCFSSGYHPVRFDVPLFAKVKVPSPEQREREHRKLLRKGF